MKIKTTRFGEIDVDESKLFTFPEGILGFPDIVRYVILDGPEGSPFKWMQAVDEPSLAFVICDPNMFIPDYQVQVSPYDQGFVQLERLTDGVVAVIMRIPDDHWKMTANLLGPLLFNPDKRIGKQLVLVDERYSTRHLVFPGGPPASVANTPDKNNKEGKK